MKFSQWLAQVRGFSAAWDFDDDGMPTLIVFHARRGTSFVGLNAWRRAAFSVRHADYKLPDAALGKGRGTDSPPAADGRRVPELTVDQKIRIAMQDAAVKGEISLPREGMRS